MQERFFNFLSFIKVIIILKIFIGNVKLDTLIEPKTNSRKSLTFSLFFQQSFNMVSLEKSAKPREVVQFTVSGLFGINRSTNRNIFVSPTETKASQFLDVTLCSQSSLSTVMEVMWRRSYQYILPICYQSSYIFCPCCIFVIICFLSVHPGTDIPPLLLLLSFLSFFPCYLFFFFLGSIFLFEWRVKGQRMLYCCADYKTP